MSDCPLWWMKYWQLHEDCSLLFAKASTESRDMVCLSVVFSSVHLEGSHIGVVLVLEPVLFWILRTWCFIVNQLAFIPIWAESGRVLFCVTQVKVNNTRSKKQQNFAVYICSTKNLSCAYLLFPLWPALLVIMHHFYIKFKCQRICRCWPKLFLKRGDWQ